MADELAKLHNEINELKKKLEETVRKITELKDQNDKQNEEITELKRQNKQQNPTHSGSDGSTSNLMPNKRSNDEFNNLVAKMDAKRSKLFANCVPNWLVEVLAWIKRMEMADSFLPTSCRTFHQLCWPKLHGKNIKPHSAYLFTFSHHFDKCGNIRANIKHSEHYKYVGYNEYEKPHCTYPFGFPIPIPSIPPPAYIQSFDRITFEFLNGELVEFIKGILPLMENVNIVVNMEMRKWNVGDNSVVLMNRLFDVFCDKMLKLEIQIEDRIEDFCRLFPYFLNQVQMLSLLTNIQNEKEIAFLVEWLVNPCRICYPKQKYLILSFSIELERYFIDRIIEEFTNSTLAQLYFVCIRPTRQIPDEFTLENKQTGEVLAFYYEGTEPINHFNKKFIARYPKDEELWKELGEKKCSDYNQIWPSNTIFLDIKKFATNKF